VSDDLENLSRHEFFDWGNLKDRIFMLRDLKKHRDEGNKE